MTVGIEYLYSLNILLWYLLGVTLSISTFPVTPAILAMGYPSIPFKIVIFSAISYFLSFFILIKFYGLLAIGMSYFIFYISSCLFICYYYLKNLKKEIES